MAYYAEKKSGKDIFFLLRKIARFFQVGCMLYAFFMLFYWLLIVSGVPELSFIDNLISPVWGFFGLFYNSQSSINGESIDFTGVIASFAFIALSNVFRVLQEYISNIDQSVKSSVMKLEVAALSAQKNIASLKQSKKIQANFVFLLDVKLTNITNFIQEGRLSSEEMTKLKTKFYTALLNNINNNHIAQKGFYKKKLFIIYKDFEYIDNFVFYARETLNSLSREFSKPSLKIDFLVGMGSLKTMEELAPELSKLDTIICLDINNEFVTTSSFKSVYETMEKKQYQLISKGLYNLSKNLHVTNNQEIYTIREN